MGLGGVAIATLPSVICAKLMFSDGLGGRDFIVIFAIQGSVLSLHMIFRGNLSPSDGDHALTLKTQKEICTHPVYRLSATLNERTREAKRNVSE